MTHPLVRRLASNDPDERRSACLEAPGDPSAVLLVDALADALGDTDATVGRAAMDALTGMGHHDAAVRVALSKALRGEDARRRVRAALAWARIEPPPIRLLPALVEGMGLPEGDLRWAAARVLVDMARLQGEVYRFVVGIVRSDDRPLVRRMALSALRELAPADPETAAAVIAASHDPDPALRRTALTALAALREPSAAVIDRLAGALLSRDPVEQRVAATALGALGAAHPGPVARAAAAALEPLRGDPALGPIITRALAASGP